MLRIRANLPLRESNILKPRPTLHIAQSHVYTPYRLKSTRHATGQATPQQPIPSKPTSSESPPFPRRCHQRHRHSKKKSKKRTHADATQPPTIKCSNAELAAFVAIMLTPIILICSFEGHQASKKRRDNQREVAALKLRQEQEAALFETQQQNDLLQKRKAEAECAIYEQQRKGKICEIPEILVWMEMLAKRKKKNGTDREGGGVGVGVLNGDVVVYGKKWYCWNLDREGRW